MILLWLFFQFQDPTTLSQQGAQAIREQRYADAERIYSQLIKADPSNPAWHMNLGITRYSLRRYSEAVPELEKFLRAKSQPGPIHLLLGVSQLKLSKACEAIAPLEKARLWKAQDAVLELADAYFGCRRYALAARAYEAAHSLRQDSSAVLRQAGHSYWEAREYPEARRVFSSLAASLPDDAEFNYEYGDTLVRREGPEAGLPYLTKAVASKPELLAAQGELGKALHALGRHSESIPHLEVAAAAEPTLLLPLSRAYRSVGRVSDADRTQQEYRRRVSQ